MFKKTLLVNLLVQFLLWFLLLITLPIVQTMNGAPWNDVVEGMKYYYPTVLIYPVIFYANYCLFIPKQLFAGRSWHFFIANISCVFVLNILHNFYLNLMGVDMSQFSGGIRWLFMLGMAILNILLILAAIGLKSEERTVQIEMKKKEAERANAEQELHRLKSQLNPHFLFNTLNNISSLVSLNQDEAQSSISQLSNMLRYVLYDSADNEVKLYKEVEFMRNYIELMRLRYTDKLWVDTSFAAEDSQTTIAPLLFISLLENAFKYGATNRHDSFITVFLDETSHRITFKVSNSLLKDGEMNKRNSGGVGLENLKKRLQLLYPQKSELAYGEKQANGFAYYESVLIINK